MCKELTGGQGAMKKEVVVPGRLSLDEALVSEVDSLLVLGVNLLKERQTHRQK